MAGLRTWLATVLAGVALPCLAQQDSSYIDVDSNDLPSARLVEALTCQLADAELPALLPQLRREQAVDFRQSERQYADPLLDLYRLRMPVSAWGQRSDAVVIAPDRVMLAVPGTPESVAAALEHALQQSADTPLSGALDDTHALVIYQQDLPGLRGLVLIGCEYRLPGLDLLGPEALPLPPLP